MPLTAGPYTNMYLDPDI